MNAPDVIRRTLIECVSDMSSTNWPGAVLADLDAAGFVIMSKADVEAIRDKALEEAAEIKECLKLPVEKWGIEQEAVAFNAALEQYALEISRLKSGGSHAE